MSERSCGDCQLCCRLLAVRPLKKIAGERCKHQKFGVGCAVYSKPAMPPECSLWTCRWQANDDMADQSRPDRSHVVIDIMPDFITAQNGEGSHNVEVIQVWVDPKHPYAYRDPQILAYLDRRGKEGKCAIIRFNGKDAIVLFPPSLTPDGKWHEREGQSLGREHSFVEIVSAISGSQP